jgi:hypothetical protein
MHHSPYKHLLPLLLLLFGSVLCSCGHSKRITYVEQITGFNGPLARSNSFLAILEKYNAEEDTNFVLGCSHCSTDPVSMRFVRITDDGDIVELCELPYYYTTDKRNDFDIINENTVLETVVYGRIQPPYGRVNQKEIDTIHTSLNLYDINSGSRINLLNTYGIAYLTDDRQFLVHHEDHPNDSTSKVYELDGRTLKYIGLSDRGNFEYCSIKEEKDLLPNIVPVGTAFGSTLTVLNEKTGVIDTIYSDTSLRIFRCRRTYDSVHYLICGMTQEDCIDFYKMQDSIRSNYEARKKSDTNSFEILPGIVYEHPWDHPNWMILNITTGKITKLGLVDYYDCMSKDRTSILFLSTINRYEPEKWKVVKLTDHIK